MSLDISPGDVVQITDERRGLVGAFLLVDEVRSWGVQGFVHHVESFEEARQIWLRLEFGKFERVGRAALAAEGGDS